MRISIIAFTDNGMDVANKILISLNNNLSNLNSNNTKNKQNTNNKPNTKIKPKSNTKLEYDLNNLDINLTRCGKGNLSTWTEEHFTNSDALIFIGAIGIATRAIAPFIQSKVKDPAIIVIDELGQFSIPILSGHLGGANKLAIKISKILNAIPIITTATDINNVFAIDTWAKNQCLKILNPENIKLVSSKLLKDETVHIKTDYPIKGDLPQNIQVNDCEDLSKYDVIISHEVDLYKTYSLDKNRKNNIDNNYDNSILYLIPPIITVGIGCRRNTSCKTIEKSVLNALKKEHCHILSLRDIASIDVKSDEKGLLEFAKKYELEFKTYSADELNNLEGNFSKSEFVKSIVKVDNVCERSAIIQNKGKLLRRKDTGEGVAIALAIKNPVLYWEE